MVGLKIGPISLKICPYDYGGGCVSCVNGNINMHDEVSYVMRNKPPGDDATQSTPSVIRNV